MVKLKDIADVCNVNISTVSRALSGKSQGNSEKYQLILDVAKQMNYTPNVTARSLASGASKTIGLIVVGVESDYYTQIMKAVEKELYKYGYVLIVGIGNYDFKKEMDCLSAFVERQVDGIIMVGPFSSEFNDKLPQLQRLLRQPSVIVQAKTKCRFATHITMNDRAGIFEAVEYLTKLGHKNLGYISEKNAKTGRVYHFKDALAEYGLEFNEDFVKIGEGRLEIGGYQAMKAMLDMKRLPTAIFCSNDNIALGASKAIYECGLRIPQDISLMGYDGIKETAYLASALTTVGQPLQEMSQLAVQQIVNCADSREKEHFLDLTVQPHLIVRESTAPPIGDYLVVKNGVNWESEGKEACPK